jgi:hypothetical protein
VLLPDALSAVADAIRDSKGEDLREMADEVFKEIMENVGDREKEYCLQWWEEQREALGGNLEVEHAKGKGKGKDALVSRL